MQNTITKQHTNEKTTTQAAVATFCYMIKIMLNMTWLQNFSQSSPVVVVDF